MVNINNLFSIGEFSKIKNVSVDTLRYYDKIGILKPEVVDKNSSYRYYSHAQLMKFDIIKFFRSVDMSLNEISKLFTQGNPLVLKDSLYAQREVLYNKAQEMLNAINTVDNIYKNLEFYENEKAKGSIYIKEIPPRKITYSNISSKLTDNINWYSEAYSELTNRLKKEGINSIYQGGFFHKMNGLTVDESSLFEVLDIKDINYNVNTLNIPGGQYLCMNYSETTRNEFIDSFYKELVKYNCNPEYLLEVYIISGSFNVMDRNFEIQCLIKEQSTVS